MNDRSESIRIYMHDPNSHRSSLVCLMPVAFQYGLVARTLFARIEAGDDSKAACPFIVFKHTGGSCRHSKASCGTETDWRNPTGMGIELLSNKIIFFFEPVAHESCLPLHECNQRHLSAE